jgi:magnesium chelatase family protein
MLAHARSCAIYGLESFLVDVEVYITSGLPAFDIVGLPDTAVRESRERVRAAIKNQEFDFPIKRITLNLAPADIKKEGPHFDLPIALGILGATEQIPADLLDIYAIAGELSLDGKVRPINGILPMAIEAKDKKLKGIMVPIANMREAEVVRGIEVIGVATLQDAADFFKGELNNPNFSKYKSTVDKSEHVCDYPGDFSEVKGQESLKRCLEISAAGHHDLLMIGPPGSGKTMIARRMPSILPSMTFKESLEVTKIYSISGLLATGSGLIKHRPFRAPHHSISPVSMVGGGRIPMPGEVTLAHHGVLFLDELPEFPKQILELLRQPMEDEKITISRLNATVTYPSKFMLLAAMNPCPCGYYGDPFRECTCAGYKINKYLSKISGPLLDRIDLQVDVAPVKFTDFEKTETTDSATIRKRVESARIFQLERYKGEVFCNSQLTPSLISRHCKLGRAGKLLIKEAFNSLRLSARAYNKILKISRTIADLDCAENITEGHIAEALRYRNLDKYYRNVRN